jgi:hypothetical protein
MAFGDDEIKEERSEQARRKKPPIDIAARKRRMALLRSFEELLRTCENEREFGDRIIAELQIPFGSRRYHAALEVFRSSRGSK